MKKLIIFGCGEIAQLAHLYFSRTSEYEVAGFTVDSGYLKETTFCGLPVFPLRGDHPEMQPPAILTSSWR